MANKSNTEFIEEYPDPEPKIYRLLELTYFFQFNVYSMLGRFYTCPNNFHQG